MATQMLALAFVGLLLAAPPVLPPEDSGPPSEAPSEAPTEPPVSEPDPPAADPPATEPPVEPEAPAEAPADPVDEPISVSPAEPAPVEPVPVEPAVQRPGAAVVAPAVVAPLTDPTATPEPGVGPEPAAATTEAEPDAKAEAEAEPEEKQPKKLGGVRILRFGLAAKLGYTYGTSQKNGLYDRDKSIQASINNGTPTMSGSGDLGNTNFGGFQGGFIADFEVVGINVWLDFHKFFNPGGMWSLLLGYDHEFGLGKKQRLRLDPAIAFGVHKVFLGDVLSELYYDKDNPEAINIGTAGLEVRGMLDLQIKIIGPLFTGPSLMLGYHYLWSADAIEVTAEKGLHYSAAWTLRVDFATPKLMGNQGRK